MTLSVRVSQRCIKLVGMGDCVPRWYWPVRRRQDSHEWECWLWWLAPWVLAGSITAACWRVLWGDLLDWAEAMRQRGE